MHECEATQAGLVDLLFDEVGASEKRRLLTELGLCPVCHDQYRTLSESLQVFDSAADVILPGEEFWAGYEERLHRRVSLAARSNGWHGAAAAPAREEYRLTMIEDAGLARRLAAELRAVAHQSQLTWPEFKRDPVGFARRSASAYGRTARRFFSERNVAFAAVSAFAVVFLLVGGLYALELLRQPRLSASVVGVRDDLELIGMVGETEVPKEQPTPDEGPAGLNRGRGGGSKPLQEKPGGGGGGGLEEQKPPSFGKVPPGSTQEQIVLARPQPPAIPNPALPVMPTIKADPALVPYDARPVPFGVPDSASTDPSSGPGKGGGLGTGDGTGVGSGSGKGLGPGRDENVGGGDARYGGGGVGGTGGGGEPAVVDPRRPYTAREVSKRAVLLSKPEPAFTEEARRQNVTGLVRLKLLLEANGSVSNISVLKGLPAGLTESAIAAARRIRFSPAQKDGRVVAQWITIEYNFNIY